MPTELILTANVPGVGAEGDQVSVSDGYARNFLIPRGLATMATPGALRKIESLKLLRTERERKELEQAQEVANKISKLNSTVELKIGEGGKVFGSVTSSDVADALASLGFKMDRKAVLLEEPIKKAGAFDIPIRIHPQVNTTFKLTVVSPSLPLSTSATSTSKSAPKPKKTRAVKEKK